MRKNPTSQSAFFNWRALIGLVCCLTGIFLALAVFGQNRWNNTPRGPQTAATGAGIISADSPDVTPTPTPTSTPAMTFTVTNTNDSDTGSLRQAILDSNANPPPANTTNLIQFNIAGSGVHTIALASSLPQISQPVIIDGYTQSGASANTLTIGDNAVILIKIDGGQCQRIRPDFQRWGQHARAGQLSRYRRGGNGSNRHSCHRHRRGGGQRSHDWGKHAGRG